jgi:hypothetical protein
MMLAVNQTAVLSDAAGRKLGELVIEGTDGDLRFGTFVPGPDYPAVKAIFEGFSDAVEQCSLSVVDGYDRQIAALDISLADGTPIHDVQIYRDGAASFRLPAPADRNGKS